MEDLAVRTTDTLVVGENINMAEWTRKRINLALELNDLNVELEIVNKLIDEYFSED